MAKTGITEYGYIGFNKAVDEFERRFIREIKRIIAETAEMMATQMKSLAPVAAIDGGNLRRSIEVTYYNKGLSAMIRVGAHYGIYVEFGTGIYAVEGNGRKTPWIYFDKKLGRYVFTRGMRPQPYFYPSLEMARKHFTTEMNKLGA